MSASLTSASLRQHRARAAGLLLSLYKAGELDTPEIWNWDALDRLPAWCLYSQEDRQLLQKVCGAMYLSPEIRFWVDRSPLLALQSVLGEPLCSQILSCADAMNLPREPLSSLMQNLTEPLAECSADAISDLLSSAGATVLAATVHESLPGELLLSSLGEGVGEISHEAALVLLNGAVTLQNQSLAATVKVS